MLQTTINVTTQMKWMHSLKATYQKLTQKERENFSSPTSIRETEFVANNLYKEILSPDDFTGEF